GVSKMDSGLSKPLDGRGEIADFDREPIPPARLLRSAVRHGLSAAGGWIGRAEDETQLAARQHRERRSGVHLKLESQVLHVKRNRRVDVADDVAHLNARHWNRPLLFNTIK